PSLVLCAHGFSTAMTWSKPLLSPRAWVPPRRWPMVRKPPTLTRTTFFLRSIMLKRGLINPQLNEALSYLGHTYSLVFADAGLPLPEEFTVVDLSSTFGLPTMRGVLRAFMAELLVEGATIATESSQEFISVVQESGKLADTAVTYISHEELKASLTGAKLIIRTGDTTPSANVVFRCGVPF